MLLTIRRRSGQYHLPVAVVQETFQHLTTAGLAEVDPAIAELIGKELERQRGQIELIASENFTWPSVLEAVGSVPTNKYAEGYPGRRYYGGCEVVDEIEQTAIDRAKELFGAEHANVQPHAGAQTNMAVYMAALEPGETILSLELSHGGHLTHGLKVNFSGRLYTIVHYGVSRETNMVDYDEVLALAKQHRPKLIVCGGSAYPRTVETDRFRQIADEVGALLLCDMAHFAGLVAAGEHPNPVEHCDFVTSTTHKTLAGPRSGFVLCREEYGQAVDRAVFPGMQGGPLVHTIAAKATCFRIAGTEAFRQYQRQIRANADTLAETLQEGGLDVLTGGTDTHLLQVDLRSTDWTGKDAEERLAEVKITVNRNTVPFDERKPTIASGIRIGTPAATMRGFDEDDFREVGRIISEGLADGADVHALAARSAALCEKRPLYPGFRGFTTYSA
jgi:glycine hydroxymethyltransferase